MTRNKKKPTNRVQQSQQAKAEQKSLWKRKATINQQLAPLKEEVPMLDTDVAVFEDEPGQREKAEQAMGEITSLIKILNGKIMEHDQSSKNYKKLSVVMEEQQEGLNEKANEQKVLAESLEEKKSRLIEKQKKLDQQAKAQASLQDELDDRQMEAEQGFARMHQEAVDKKRNTLTALEEAHNKKLREQTNQLYLQEAALFDRERAVSEQEAEAEAGFIGQQKAILNDYETRKLKAEEDISRLEEQLEKQQRVLSMNKTRSQEQERAEREWQAKKKDELESQYRTEIESLTSQLAQERDNRKLDREKISKLQRELISFRDLSRSLEHENIEDVQEELENLRQQNREFKRKLYTSSEEDLDEKCELLEERVSEQQDEIADLRQELEEANAERHKRNLSVGEKHHLEKEKRVLELHNKGLDVKINALEARLYDLVERQHGVKTFPALSQMDQLYRNGAANLQPVPDLKSFADQLRWGMASFSNAPLYYREEDIRLFLAGLAMSNLHILQGMSGTGKTSLAKAFAQVVGGHCTDIAVQAGWRDKDDLLGHYNAFEKRFYESEALQALYRAQLPAYQDRINIILLDEMNLSRPEQYFADFNSALEKHPADPDRNIVLLEVGQDNGPKMLKEGRKLFVPDNVWFIGTANHDETTNEFADKTYDRAHVMELSGNPGKFSTDQYEGKITYSFGALKESFDTACQKHEKQIERLLHGLNESELKQTLANDFTVSWTNRFERHAKRFIPVIKEAGGSIEEGLDHLLATRLFRKGKVTGRYDISPSDLEAVSKALKNTWKQLKLKGDPSQTLTCIENDRRRMERGA